MSGLRIFLDDLRTPKTEQFDHIIRHWNDWLLLIAHIRMKDLKISYVSFDHDLGTLATGYDCAKVLVEYDMDYNILAKDFTFNVHSANTVGAENIRSYLNNYLRSKKL